MHDSGLIVTLAGAFGLAFLFGMLAVRVKLPPLVGYLAAGVVIGPFTPGYVADTGLASQLAEVGVILLMFGVGLHFSIADLLAVRKIAVPGALIRIVVVTLASAAATLLWGWSFGTGIVFGIALSVASTVVVLKALDELGLTDSGDGRIAVGWLVVEDLAMVLALVLLPPLAPVLGGHVAATASTLGLGAQVTITLLKVAAFVLLMLYVGTRVVPWLLGRVARTGSRELFTLAVLAVALGIGVGAATLFGVSFALGAFFAGVVIAESDLSHQAAADALPLQDAFAVLFFVSVGMLFDYTVLVREPLRVLEVLAIVVLGKAAVTFGIVRMFKRPVRSALILSSSLAQIGEFSFILAGLGISLGILQEEARSLILGGAILSITVNPMMMAAANRVERWLQERPALLARLEPAAPVIDVGQVKASAGLRDHVVLIGHGRVGRRIGDALRLERVPYLVVERDRVAVDNLRKKGIPAVFGDAARHGILDHVILEHAKLMVIASPDPYQTRRVIEIAHKINPTLHIAARTHSEVTQAFLEQLGVGRAFMGERELALSMAHYSLMHMGKTDDEADETVDAMRRHTSLGIRILKRT
ncbi:MAG TPA: YbaL family putative K(+) efflux transporter [Gemmatimonadaceae bacterium]